MKLIVEYFAILREQAGKDRESLQIDVATPAELYAQLSETYGFDLRQDRLRVAVNDEFVDWGRELAEGDRLVFIPPVAGG